jgi:hypothetical protein
LLRDSSLDAVKKIFPTMKNSLSQDSLRIIESTYGTEFKEAEAETDVVKFWDIIKRSHTYAGLKVSLSDRRNARRRLSKEVKL